MDKITAEKTAAAVLNACEILNLSLCEIKQNCSHIEFVEYRTVMATAIANLDLYILAKIYAEYPDIGKLDKGLWPE